MGKPRPLELPDALYQENELERLHRMHMDVLVVTDFFIAKVWTQCGLAACDVLFFIRIATREVLIAVAAPHSDKRWMRQIACNVTMAEWGVLASRWYLIHDTNGQFCPTIQ
jgi:hypothetical protein